jgi:two-component system cell cycle response regulator
MVNEGTSKKKILIAEDDPVSCHLLNNLLIKWNYDVTIVIDGIQALRILESEGAPRLAVLDWMMPGMEGVQVCQRIRERTGRPYIYVLLLTGRSEKQDILQGLELGADDYLTKPFDAQELRARLHVGQRILNLQDSLLSAQEELQFRATHDTLTGTANRGAALDAISREHARYVREKVSFGIIMVDLDHFKNINDTYGHRCGDAVLKEAARRMSACVRLYDTVCRYGGEEFLIVVVSANDSITLALAERIRVAIESQPFATDSGEVHLTASFGVAVSSDEGQMNADALLQLADEALYLAKHKGRNRSELAVSPEFIHSGHLGAKGVQSGPR